MEMNLKEIKHGDLQHAVRDINSVLGTDQKWMVSKAKLTDFILDTINGCIGADPEDENKTIWTNPKATELKPETIATYESLIKLQEENGDQPGAEEKPTEAEPKAAETKTAGEKTAEKSESTTENTNAKYSRSMAFIDAINQGGTKQQLAELMDKNYSEKTGKKSNMSESKFWTTNFLRLLNDLNLIQEAGGIFKMK